MVRGLDYLAEQSIRLRRTKWADPQPLADELWVILSRLEDSTQGASQVLSPVDGSVIDLPAGSTLNISPFDFLFPEILPTVVTTSVPGTKTTVTTFYVRGTIPGKVISGSGSSYQVQIYPHGPNGPDSQVVTVVPLDIAQEITALRGLNPGWEPLLIDSWFLVYRTVQLEVSRIETIDELDEVSSVVTSTVVLNTEHFMQLKV